MRWRLAAGTMVLALGAAACGESLRHSDGSAAPTGGAGGGTGGDTSAAGDAGLGGSSGTGGSTGAGGGVGGMTVAVGGGSGGAGVAGSSGASGGAAGMAVAGRSGTGPTAPSSTGADGLTDAEGKCVLWPHLQAMPFPAVMVGSTHVDAREHDCTSLAVGDPLKVPLDDGGERLLFHYDVNGDTVDDLFVGPWHATPDGPALVTLIASKLADDGTLSFEPTRCALDVPIGYSYFVRDVDDDGVPDLVVGKSNGVLVLLNHEDGLATTVDYDFDGSSAGHVSLMDAAVGDFDGDGTRDVAVGYDRTPDGMTTIEIGTLLLTDAARAAGEHGPEAITTTKWDLGMIRPGTGTNGDELGYLAAYDGGHALVGLSSAASWEYRDGGTSLLPAPISSTPTFIQSFTFGEAETALIGTRTDVVAFDPSGVSGTTLSFPASFEHDLNRDFGGGIRRRSYYLLDFDGDGDADLVETNANDLQGSAAPEIQFAFHTTNPSQPLNPTPQWILPEHFADPITELPFLAVGKAQGLILVSAADTASGLPLRVMGLYCTNLVQ